MLQIKAIGGYLEVGKNMSLLQVDDEAVVLDMGVHLDHYIEFTEDEDLKKISGKQLIEVEAAPNINLIPDTHKVKAIVCSHAHLDHLGAVPFISNKFNCPIISTPFACAVLESILKDENMHIKNKIKQLNVNDSVQISDKITIEFINMTHSTPQTVMIAVHTPYGIVLYSNDFKFDNFPVLGKQPNFKRLEHLSEEGVVCLIVDSLYADAFRKTPSESVARSMLQDVMLGTQCDGVMIVTTFSSHIARLKSIIEFGKKLNRNIIFLGRSLSKYVSAAESINLVNFSKDVKLFRFGGQIRKQLKKIMKDGKHKYLIVCTGGQGEPKSVMSKITTGYFKFDLDESDSIIFSCSVIPSNVNKGNREELEKKLMDKGVRIFKDIHASGHASREDLRDLINLVKPQHIIPAHSELNKSKALIELASEMGYKQGETSHILGVGHTLRLQ